ncbi:helix-turn-helix domain-containing protein [Lysinibacillus xylanilyticus]|uniref:helix-turn-helix domain-containing protein n=1 Tax=Lysinibacillus xylanilyticus TaxID=582475 RepID=UPI0037F6FAD5
MPKNKRDKDIKNTNPINISEVETSPEKVFLISPIIGDKLKSLRNLKKLTLGEVANRSGFSAQAISLCERAKRMPSPNMLLVLARVYDYSEEELFKHREETIIDSVHRYGEDAPVSVHNEYEILMNARENYYSSGNSAPDFMIAESSAVYGVEVKTPKDYLDLGTEPATKEELEMAKAYLLALRTIKGEK